MKNNLKYSLIVILFLYFHAFAKDNILSKSHDNTKKKNIETSIKEQKNNISKNNKVEEQKKNEKKEKLSEIQILEKKQEKEIKNIWIKSVFVPGLGQIYNGKIWKTGVIWLGFGGFFGGAYYYNEEYKTKKNKDIKHRVYRNGLLVGAFFWYVLNILDAYVDAHMSTYDISPKISDEVAKKTIGTEKKQTLRNKRKERKKLMKKKRFKKKKKTKTKKKAKRIKKRKIKRKK